MALNLRQCETGRSADAAERRAKLPYVCRVVGVVTLQRLQGKLALKLHREMHIQMQFNRKDAEESRENAERFYHEGTKRIKRKLSQLNSLKQNI